MTPAGLARVLLADCAEHGVWLIVDAAYEHIVHADAATSARRVDAADADAADADADDARLISLHTFSKSYGLAGWRVGYMHYPRELHGPLLQAQDSLPTHASTYAQRLAHAALTVLGPDWVAEQVATLAAPRAALWEALTPLRAGREAPLTPPAGAFYYLVPLPRADEAAEVEAVRALAEEFSLLTLPGSIFGAPGHLRVSYGAIAPDAVDGVATRLERAARHLAARG